VLTTAAMLGFVGGRGMSKATISLVDKTGSWIFSDTKAGSNSNFTDDGDVEDVIKSMVEDMVKAAQ
jgi:hypothetical protein